MFSEEFLNEMRIKLISSKDELTDQLKNLSVHTEIGDEVDENAKEFEMDSVNQDLIAGMREDLRKIDTALEKLDQGTYGLDENGNEIPEERLRLIPWADKNV